MADIIQLAVKTLYRIPLSHGIAVALSGGADSVALAAAMAKAIIMENRHRPLLLLHCNFHLRGDESNRDAAIALEIAEKLSAPFQSIDFKDVPDIAARNGESIEMTCRQLRYAWFDSILSSLPVTTWLALGHHNEDNRETLLLNLFRGTGTRGLCGMDEFDPKRRFIRPLLHASRSEIEAFLSANDLPWIVDSSNLIPDVKRNRIRLNIIPAIQKDFPDALQGLDTTTRNLADDYAILHQALESAIQRITLSPGIYDLLKLTDISASPRRVIFEIVREYGFNASQADNMASAIRSREAKHFGSSTHIASIHRGTLAVSPKESHQDICFQADDPFKLADMCGEFSCERISGGNLMEIIRQFATDKIPFYAMDASGPLPAGWIWRQPIQGDRIAPFGMNGKTRLVSDILSDAHASPTQKKQARLLVVEGTPVWLAPWRASAFRPVTRTSEEMLLFRL